MRRLVRFILSLPTRSTAPGPAVRSLPRTPLVVGANDAPRSDVGEVPLGEFVVVVIMEDY
jgi:hypothetical protein